MTVTDVSTGRRRDAGSAFRREMASRIDQGERVGAGDEYDADALNDGWSDEFQRPYRQ